MCRQEFSQYRICQTNSLTVPFTTSLSIFSSLLAVRWFCIEICRSIVISSSDWNRTVYPATASSLLFGPCLVAESGYQHPSSCKEVGSVNPDCITNLNYKENINNIQQLSWVNSDSMPDKTKDLRYPTLDCKARQIRACLSDPKQPNYSNKPFIGKCQILLFKEDCQHQPFTISQ